MHCFLGLDPDQQFPEAVNIGQATGKISQIFLFIIAAGTYDPKLHASEDNSRDYARAGRASALDVTLHVSIACPSPRPPELSYNESRPLPIAVFVCRDLIARHFGHFS